VELRTDGLLDGNRFAAQHRFVGHDPTAVEELPVRRQALPSFDPHEIPGHERASRHAYEPPATNGPRERRRQRAQLRQCLLRAKLLERAQPRVEQEHDRDDRALDGPSFEAVVEPVADVEQDGEDEHVDERAPELAHEAEPHGIGLGLG